MNITKTCCAKKPDGSNCEAPVVAGSEFCFFHDPSKAQQRREAQVHGGRQNRMKTLDSTAPDVRVEDVGDARALLVQTINWVLKGEIDPRVANSVGFLLNMIMKAVAQDNLEARIEELEALHKVRIPTLDLKLTGAREEHHDKR
jgi:hypothetical protein